MTTKAKTPTPSAAPAVALADNKAEDRGLAALKQKEKNLENKISKRIPKFPEEHRAAALEQTNRHLEDVRKQIKDASKS